MSTVNLSALQPHVKGQYSPGDNVTCLIDASKGGFETDIPDASVTQGVEFTYKKIDSSTEKVTFNMFNNQDIDGFK